jgi:hypothetical protein
LGVLASALNLRGRTALPYPAMNDRAALPGRREARVQLV